MPTERSLGRLALAIATFGTLWLVLCRHLSGEWSLNEQYSYGWFVPLFCAYLLWLRWEDAPSPRLRRREPAAEMQNVKLKIKNRRALAIAIAITTLLLLLPVRVFEIGNPDWRPLGWMHCAIVVAISLLAVWSIGGRRWLRHFAFPIAFIFIAVPWVSPIETPLVQGLMRVVAAAATEAVSMCGIPAQLEGNLIRISSGLVGVNEACSGVRALQTALMIGLLFGELKRFTLGRRVTLVAVAIALSMLANFFRTFFLVLIAANKGLGAVDHWHDFAGYSIVALVFLGTLAAAALLGKVKIRNAKVENEKRARPESGFSFNLPAFYFAIALCWLLFVEIASAAWYRAHERDLVARTRWSVRWPSSQQSFRDLKIDENVRQTLRFDEGRAARWYAEPMFAGESKLATKPQDFPRLHCTLFFFRWNPGGGTLLRARAHRPDICLPSSGWEQTADHGVRLYDIGSKLALPFQHLEFVRKRRGPFESDQFAHTFFCLQQDWMEPKNSAGPRTALTSSKSRDWGILARVHAVEDGLRDLGQQTMELVFVAPHRVEDAAAETKFAEYLPDLIKVEEFKK